MKRPPRGGPQPTRRQPVDRKSNPGTGVREHCTITAPGAGENTSARHNPRTGRRIQVPSGRRSPGTANHSGASSQRGDRLVSERAVNSGRDVERRVLASRGHERPAPAEADTGRISAPGRVPPTGSAGRGARTAEAEGAAAGEGGAAGEAGEPMPSRHGGGDGGGLRVADGVRRGRFRSGRGRRGPPRGLSCCCSLHHLILFLPMWGSQVWRRRRGGILTGRRGKNRDARGRPDQCSSLRAATGMRIRRHPVMPRPFR